jgi:hypothetical protein
MAAQHAHVSRVPISPTTQPGVYEPYKRNGRPQYAPTEKDRERVQAMTAFGIPGRQTARLIGCRA